MTSEDRGQGDDERRTGEPQTPPPGAPEPAPLRPDPEWGRPRPAPRTERRISWGSDSEPEASGGGPADADRPGASGPGSGTGRAVPPPPPASGRPPGVTAGSIPPPPRPAEPARQGGERPARSWATPRIAAPSASGDRPADDPAALRLPVDEPAGDAPRDPATGPSGAPSAPPPPPPPGAGLAARAESALERRGNDRSGGVAITELAQQLAATQAQVTSLSAQLTTLAHRLTYDLERGAQATSERVLRDLDQLPDQISFRVGAHLGPALDDLTDQVEADGTRLRQLVEGDLATRLRSMGETIDALPLANVEVLNGLQAIGGDLEDRLTRFATRIADQVAALEAATTAELAKLRDQVEEVQQAAAPRVDQAALDRMAGQIERLVDRPSVTTELVDAVELLITEHLDALQERIDAQIATVPSVIQDELEAVRTDTTAGVAASEEVLTERIDALESGLAARLEELLGEQGETVDGLLADRHAELLGALPKGDAAGDERLEELRASVASLADRVEELAGSLPSGEGGGTVDDAALAGIRDELKALRRRITLRFEGGDAPAPALTPEQLKELAAQIALHLT